jgi:3-keto-5-aminohexanoate cleavage enzyme
MRMGALPPLIIEACEPRVELELQPFTETPTKDVWEREIQATVGEVVDQLAVGAAIAHLHGMSVLMAADRNYPVVDIEATAELFRRVAAKTDAIRLYARAAAPLEVRTEVARKSGGGKPEMGAMIFSDADFFDLDRQTQWSRSRIRETLTWYREMGMVPECEIFQVGATWNLRWAVRENLIDAPIWVNLVSEAQGFNWAPATVESVQHRVRYFPENCMWHATAFTEPRSPLPLHEHSAFLMHVIAMGGHVRIGREDRLWIRPGEPARSNAELVELVVWMAKQLGREIATPDQARKMLRMPRSNY